MGVGMPFCLLLQEFGEHVHHAFGHTAYHVGSSLEKKDGWRDVDVRLMLPDDEYERLGFGDPKIFPHGTHESSRWVSTVLAWSCFGKHLTGLPIDFQIQPLNWANEHEGRKTGAHRSALFSLERSQANTASYYRGRADEKADSSETL